MSAPPDAGNLYAGVRASPDAEQFTGLFKHPGARLERIVSTGQASPPGFWYEQAHTEWVLLLQGAARLRFEDEAAARELAPGDWLAIAPRRRHRVEATQAQPPTVWLALHLGEAA